MKMNALILVVLLFVGLITYFIVRPLLHFPKNRVKILMCGRSTMAFWFKHWNWPYPLRIKTTYKPWPISYHKYARGKLYLEYFRLAGPRSKDPNVQFGENMLKAFEAGLDRNQYDAAFFKFCFVDFRVRNGERKALSDNLKNTILKAQEMTSKRKMKLIVGNALPLLEPNDATLHLQKEYNAWLEQFASSHDDVLMFDLFGPLTDSRGRLKIEFAHAKDDQHPGERAYSLLDKTFFKEIEHWLAK